MSRNTYTALEVFIIVLKICALILILRLALFAFGVEGYIPVIDDVISILRRILYSFLGWAERIFPSIF